MSARVRNRHDGNPAAGSQDPAGVRVIGLRRCDRNALLGGTALRAAALVVLAAPAAQAQLAAGAHPTGGQVVGGSASIAQKGNTTTINQSTGRAAIDWQSFNVGSQSRVTFNQPNAKSVVLNTVVGPNPSEIAGRITANGVVAVVNQSGVIFDRGSQVDTAGLIVSAAGMTRQNFMAGHMVFDQAPHPGASVVNNGTITIRQAGLAALVAPQVVNNGLIQAKLGRVILGGASTYTLDLYGDGMLALNVTGQVTNVTVGGRTMTALVTNAGTILADGGSVVLNASAADGLIRTLVDAGGTIAANSVGNQAGRVLVQGIGGSVDIAGAVSATGVAANTVGGTIVANATGSVTIAAGAHVDASGQAGGGLIALGTTAARARAVSAVSTLTAQSVNVAAGARVSANAMSRGHGGQVTLLSKGLTSLGGVITVLGGAAGGNGGQMEVSGEQLDFSGLTDARAPHGTTGGLLIDPLGLVVSDTKPASNKLNGASWMSPASIEAQNANVTISTGGGDLDFAFTAGKTNTLVLQSHSLSVTASGTINIDNGFSISAGSVTFSGTGGMAFGTNTGVGLGLGAASTAAAVISGSAVTMNAGGDLDLGDANVSASTSLGLFSTLGSIASTGVLTTPILKSSSATGISLTGANAIDTTGVVSSAVGDIIITDSGNLKVNGAMTAGGLLASEDITLVTGGTLTLAAEVAATHVVSLTANAGDIVESAGGGISAALLTGAATGGSASLDGTNAVGTLGAFTATHDLSFANGAAIVVAGNVHAGGTLSLAAGGLFPSLTVDTGDTVGAGNAIVLVADSFAISGSVSTTGLIAMGRATAGGFSFGGLGDDFGGHGLTGFTAGTIALGSLDGVTNDTLTNALNIGQSIGSAGLTLGLFANGAISQTAGSLTAALIEGKATGNITLAGASNAFGTLGSLASTGGSLNVVDNASLTTIGSLSAKNALTLAVTGAGDRLAIQGSITGSSVTLSSPGQITQNFGLIQATSGNVSLTSQNAAVIYEGTLQASSGLVALSAGLSVQDNFGGGGPGVIVASSLSGTAGGAIDIGNAANNFGTIAGLSGGSITILEGSGFFIAGAIDGGVVSLTSTLGAVSEASGGSVTATSLTGSAHTAALFAQTGNHVTSLGDFAANSFTLTQAGSLSVAGTVSAGASALISTGAAALTIPGFIDATSLSLTASSVAEAGALTVGTLSGKITNGATLTGSNAVDTLGAFGASSLVLDDASSLTLAGNVVAASVALTSAGTIGQSGGGITATSLTGSAGSSVSLTSTANSVTNLGSFTSAGGFALWDAPSVTVTDAVSTTGSATLLLHAKTVDVAAAGTLTSTGGTISLAADTLTLTGDVTTGAHEGLVGITLIDAGTLTIGSATLPTVTTGTLSIGSLDGVTASGNVTAIVLNAAPTGPDSLALFTSGTLTAASGISVGTLTGSVGTADFSGTDTISTLRNFAVTAGSLTFADATSLALAGSVSVKGQAKLTVDGDLTEGSGSAGLTASSLTGSVSGAIDLGGPSNAIGSLGNLTAATGPLILDNAANLSVTGSVASGGDMTIAVTGASHSLSLTATGTLAPVGDLALSSDGAINEAAGSNLSAVTLTATAGGSVSLIGNNLVGTLGSSGAAGLFLFDDGQALTVSADANIVAGSVTLASQGTLTQLAGSSAGTGRISATSGNVSLTSIAGDIAFGGTLAAAQGVQFTALTGAVIESDGTNAGAITAASVGGTAMSMALAGSNAIGTIGGLHATAGDLVIDDAPASGSSTVSVTGTNSAAAGGTFAIALSGAGSFLDLDGVLSAGAVTLAAPGGISQTGGSIASTTLAFTAAHGSAVMTGGTNKVGTLLTSSAAGNVTFDDGIALSVNGTVTAGNAASPASLALRAPALAVATGALSAPGGTITLATDTLTLGGVVSTGAGTGLVGIDTFAGSILTIGPGAFNGVSTGVVALGSLNGTSASGHVTEIDIDGALDLSSTAPTLGLFTTATGTVMSATGIHASTLIGNAGTVSLTGNNQVSTLASFTAAGGFTLDQPGSLDVTGPVDGVASTSISLTGAAAVLTIDGSVIGSATHLGGATIAIPGTVTAVGLLDLSGSTAVSETGTITAGTLTGDGAFTVDLVGSGAGAANSNTIGTLGNFTAAGGFTLVDSEGLAVTGSLVSAGAADLTIAGALDAHLGSIAVGTLSGSAAGSATLTGSNAIGTLDGFSASGITVENAGDLSLADSVAGGGSLSVTTGGSLLVLGSASVTGSVTSLKGGSIDIASGGSVAAPTSLSLTSTAGGITEEGGITTGILTGSSGSQATMLTGIGNAIKTLGNYLSGAFSLSQGSALSVTGTLTSAATTLSAGTLTIPGAILSSATVNLLSASTIGETGQIQATSLSGSAVGDASLTGTNRIGALGTLTAATIELDDGLSLAVNGRVTGASSVNLTLTGTGPGEGTLTVAGAGSLTGSVMVLNASEIDIDGAIDAAASLDLVTSGSVDEPASGSITTSVLSANAGGSLDLAGTANLIGSLGDITTPDGFTYSQAGSLTIGGTISGGSFATITSGDLLTVAAAGSITSASTSLTGSAIAIAGTVTGTSLVSLIATSGNVDETAAVAGGPVTGSVNAGTLSGSAAGDVTLLGANSITSLGSFSAGDFTLLDAGGLTVGGTQTIAGSLSLSAGSLTIASLIDAASVDLTSSGTISESAGGAIDAGSLTGSSTGAAAFGGSNLIGTLNGFTAADFALVDGQALDVTGSLQAATISLAATALQIDGGITATGLAGLLTLTASGDATAGDGTIDESAAGSITAATLTGSAQGSASLTGANSITTLGNFSAAPLTLDDATGLTIASGAIVAGRYTPSGGTAVSGPVTLSVGGTLAIDGTLDATGESLALTAAQITASGHVFAASLTGSTTGAAGFTAAGNSIVSVGSFTANGFSLVDAVALLTIDGPLQGGGSVDVSNLGTLAGTGNLLVSGSIGATDVTLHADQSLSIAGSIAAPSSLAVSAGTSADTGTLSETGGIVAGTLTGNVQGVADFTGNGANSITVLGSFTATGGLTLVDDSKLTITGPIVSGPFLDISSTDSLTIGDITGGTIAFGGSFITIDGTIDATSSLALTASGANAHGVFTPGSITEVAGGAVMTPLLTGKAAGDIDLSIANVNKIASIGKLSAGGFELADTENLAITGPLASSAGATLTDAGHAISVSGSITATDASLSAGDITIAGSVDGSHSVTLAASASGTAHGTILETGALITPLLTGSATGSASFAGANDIDALGSFSAAGLTLDDASALTVSGPVSGGSSLSLTANSLSLTGKVSAVAATLIATSGSLSESGAGALSATSLNGSASGTVSLGGANTLTSLGSFTAHGFALNDSSGLSIAGPLAGGPSVGITAASLTIPGTLTATVLALSIGGSLTETGSVEVTSLTGSLGGLGRFTGSNSIGTLGDFTSAGLVLDDTTGLQVAGTLTSPTATLVAANIGIPGMIRATDLVLTSLGSISESGTLLVSGTLSGSAAGTASLIDAGFANSIANLGSFTAAGLDLNDGTSLRVVGPVNGGTSVVLDDNQGLTIAGSLTGSATALTAASLDVPGSITAATSLALSIGGTIAETGGISTALLSGTAGGAAAFSGTNAIASVGPFGAQGLILDDASALTIVGAVTGGASAAITAASIDIPGSVAATSVALVSTSGGITETGSVSAGTLTGAASTSASLTGSNSIATLGDFTVSTGFALNDTAALAVTGSIASETTALTAASITSPGDITATDALTLTATSGGIDSTGGITTGFLSGSATGSTAFTGTNRIASLGNFIASGFALLRDTVALAIGGVVQAGDSAVISSIGSLGVTGSITGSTVALTGAAIGVSGTIDAPSEFQVSATSGDFISTGSIDTALLDGSASGTSSITGANLIAAVGGFSSASFTLANGGDLAISGPLDGGSVVDVTDGGALSVTGAVTGSVTTLSAASIDIPGSIAAGSSLALTSAGAITETGGISTPLLTIASAGGSVALLGGNAIGSLGDITAAGFTLNDTPDLTVVGALNGEGSVLINEAGAITVASGAGINGDSTSLNAAALTIAGQVTAATALAVAVNGSINETGVITTALMTGNAGGEALLNGANQIAALGNFTSGANFALQDVTSLAFNGALNAAGGNITVKAANITEASDASIVTGTPGPSATTGTITLGTPGTMELGGMLDAPTIILGNSTSAPTLVTLDGTTIITGASEAPGTSKPAFPSITGVTPGIFVLAGNFKQNGTTVVNGNGKSGTIEITLAHRTGSIVFDPDAGLVAPHSELFLNLGLGYATGKIDVAGLNISYVEPGSNMPSNLYGTVDGEQGPAASGAAFIKVLPNADYRLNSCPIQSVNCILVSPIIVPVTDPVDDVEVTTPRRRRDDDDLIIPNVGEQDF